MRTSDVHRSILALTVTLVIVAPSASAQDNAATTLTVATRAVPPFSFQSADGEWEGITIDLWNAVAAETSHATEFRDMELDAMLAALEAGTIDAAAAAITVTAEREAVLDFTHPYYTSGLGIAVVPERGGLFISLIRRLFSIEFLQALVALGVVLLVAGALVWLFERKKNAEQFGGPTPKGLGNGFWWAAVTMTTVGYGDKAPQTPGGRLVALVWMFASIIIISSFTAAIATSLTIGELSASIAGPEDLPGKRVGVLAESTGETYLLERNVRPRRYDDVQSALTALAQGDLDAVVYDAPIMRYYAAQQLDGEVSVLPNEFDQQEYAIALPQGSPLREAFNRVILEKTSEDWWLSVISRYLGSD